MKKIMIYSIVLVFAGIQCRAEQWQVLGTRPMGMGGAFVAMAKGPIAQYWNPAGLAQADNVSGFDFPVLAGVEFTGNMLENASKLGDLASKYSALQTAQTNGTAANADQVSAFVKSLVLLNDMNKPGAGAMIEAGGGLNLKFSKIAVSVNYFISIGLDPFVDLTNIGLGPSGTLTGLRFNTVNETTLSNASYTAARDVMATAINTIGFASLETALCGAGGCNGSIGTIDNATELSNVLVNQAITNGLSVQQTLDVANMMTTYATGAAPIIQSLTNPTKAYTNNASNLELTGASFTEIAFGYAKDVPQITEGLSVGTNLKLVQGKIGYAKFKFLSESNTGNVVSNALDDTKAGWKPSIDIGFLYDLKKLSEKLPMNPRTGLVFRNINGPKFEKPASAGGGDYKLDGQIRWGLALNPSRFWNIALDMDITKNETPLKDFESRQLSAGTEFNVFNKPSFNIPLRFGLMKNLAESDSNLAYTAGIGINMVHLHIDIAGVMSSGSVEVEGTEYPEKGIVSASIGLLF